jgi:hypothetical protein
MEDDATEEVYLRLKHPVAFTGLFSGLGDCLDYAGEHGEVAFVGTRGRGVSIAVAGETSFTAPDGVRYRNRTAESAGYDKFEVEWEEENRFELVLVEDGRELGAAGSECDLDRAIRRAMEILENPERWKGVRR